MKRPGLLLLIAAVWFAACGGPPPSLPPVDILVEKEVSDLQVGLVDLDAPADSLRLGERRKQLGVHGVSIALIYEGELRWVRAFGETPDGAVLDPATPVAAGDLLEVLRELLAIRLDQPADQDGTHELAKQLFEPLKMTRTSIEDGALETTAEDLAQVVIDLQKAHAGKPSRRLRQEQAQLLFRTGRFADVAIDSVPPAEPPFTLGGEGQARYFEHRDTAADHLLHLTGFVFSGHGAVVIADGARAATLVDELLAGLAEIYDWPAYRATEAESFREPGAPSDP